MIDDLDQAVLQVGTVQLLLVVRGEELPVGLEMRGIEVGRPVRQVELRDGHPGRIVRVDGRVAAGAGVVGQHRLAVLSRAQLDV